MTDDQENSLWRVSDLNPSHIPQIRKLFKDVFAKDMSDEHWHWKYGDGRGVGVVVEHDDEVICFFGGTERRVLFNGEELCAMQCGDSMVAEAHRGTLSKKGPFYLSVTSFLGQYVGEGLPYLLSYGFPNARAMRLAERLGMYEEVGTMLEVEWSSEQCSDYEGIEFDFASDQHRKCLESLWSKMASEFTDRAIGIRNWAYLKQRFHDHPTQEYQVHIVSFAGNPESLGILVTRRVEDRLLLVDVVAPTRDICHLIRYAKQLAFACQSRDLFGWLTEIDSAVADNTGMRAGEVPLRLPLGIYSPGLRADDVRDKWFFMCGDSDFL